MTQDVRLVGTIEAGDSGERAFDALSDAVMDLPDASVSVDLRLGTFEITFSVPE